MSMRSAVEKVMDGLGRRDPEPFVALLADDAVFEIGHCPTGPLERYQGKDAIAELVGGIRHLHRMESEPHRLYVDEEADVVAIEASWVIQDTSESPPVRIVQAIIGEFRAGLVVASDPVLRRADLEATVVVYEYAFEEMRGIGSRVANLTRSGQATVDVAPLLPREAFRLPAVAIPQFCDATDRP
jgi:hypothetical protein